MKKLAASLLLLPLLSSPFAVAEEELPGSYFGFNFSLLEYTDDELNNKRDYERFNFESQEYEFSSVIVKLGKYVDSNIAIEGRLGVFMGEDDDSMPGCC